MYLPAEFRRGAREIKNVDAKSEFAEHWLRQLYQTPSLRHFARASMFATGRSVDDKDAWSQLRIVMASLRLFDSLTRVQPVDRDVVVGIGEPWTALRVPGDLRELL